MDLLDIYLRTLDACAPDVLVRRVLPHDAPRNVVAIGKCGARLLDGVAQELGIARAFVAVPEGYGLPTANAEIAIGGHPDMTSASFDAGRKLLEFVDSCDDILFLISGGGSACVEVPIDGISERELAEINATLVASGLPIGEINIVRKHLSAIKGGQLAQRVRGRSMTLIYSDVARGALADVASGPTLPDRSTIADAAAIAAQIGIHPRTFGETVKQLDRTDVKLIADNDTLLNTVPTDMRMTIECDVATAAQQLFDAARNRQPGQLLAAGGEPTVIRRGDGRGGRCTELAARFALLALDAGDTNFDALFGSSDGVDGTSGAAGILLRGIPPIDRSWANRELARSNSLVVAEAAGEAIRIPVTGNNLRDLYLLARR
ncbi:MAG: glycerate 2-kinase [Acidobacteriota bacterium]|jgi:hydroxypyruvate reductase|nr:glycerate 2-kinase [Acidobacteriota bacterium]